MQKGRLGHCSGSPCGTRDEGRVQEEGCGRGGAGEAVSPGQPGVAAKGPSKTSAEKAGQKDRPHSVIPFIPSKCRLTHSDRKQAPGCLGRPREAEARVTAGMGALGGDRYFDCDDGFLSMCAYMCVGHTCVGQIDQSTHFKYVQFIYYMSITNQ